MSDKAQIPLAPEYCNILRQCRNSFCKVVETKFNCTAILNNLLEDSFGSNASGVSGPELKYYTKLSSGVKVSVWKNDLTCCKVEAVVNAANERLSHGGGLALALSVAGGPMLQHYSEQIIKQRGSVPTGSAVVTPSGYLPCNKVIHAVGPCLPSNPTQREVEKSAPLLRQTISSILDIVVRENISSVAIPALSSGLFHFPRNLCADIIVTTIKQYDEFNAFSGRNVEINLVNNDDPSVQEMERACVQIMGPPTITGSYSEAVKGRNQSKTFYSGNSLQLGNVTLHLKEGLIEDQEVDVIVNTIAENLNLSTGEISKAILNKAGEKIQKEINKEKVKYVTGGEIFVTGGYKLNCAKVYHTVCRSRSEPGATKILSSVVFECLRKAVSTYKSIAFPAIGTGNLCFHKHDVAQTMMDAVAEFAKRNSNANLDINFIVFPGDIEMMEAFRNKLNSMKGGMKSSELPNDPTKSSVFGTKERTVNETPTLEFSCVFMEALREAKAWTMNMLNPQNGTITIMNNHVIYLGQNDHADLLSLQTNFGVNIKVFFRSGSGGISITGHPASISCVAIEVESMLCQAQEDFARNEESDLLYSVVRWQYEDGPLPRKISAALEKAYLARNEKVEFHDDNVSVNLRNKCLIDNSGKTSMVDRKCLFKDYKPSHSFYTRTPGARIDVEMERKVKACGLSVIRVEKIENAVLQQIFELNRKRLKDKPQTLYQCVSAQFCDLICRVGFQKDFAPPAEQKYGSGIYFSSTPGSALKLWNGQKEEYIYIIQAQVLTGKSTIGSPDLTLPPAIDSDPLNRYDSLSDMQHIHVIFSGQQALPEYLIVCEKSSYV